VLRAYGDGNLFGEPYGEGPIRVVWLHGWARRGQDFALAATQLAAAGVASVALDLPGFGSSPAPSSPGGARHYAALLVPTLRGLGDEPIVLVGHSFGGRVATVIAATNPELVRALVLTGVPLIRRSAAAKPPAAYRLVRWLHSRGLVGDRRLESARQRYGSTDYRRATGVIRDVLVATVNESYEDELRRLSMPVAMVWGSQDREVPSDVARDAAAMVASPHTLRFVEGVGHLLPTEAPGELVDEVRGALT
jgi:pimeloyl-ACP methyl ester carboxylesterase